MPRNSATPLGDGAPRCPCLRGDVAAGAPLPRGRISAPGGLVEAGQRQEAWKLSRYRDARACPESQDTLERVPGVWTGARGPRGILLVRGCERNRGRPQQSRAPYGEW